METEILNSATVDTALTVLLTCSLALLAISVMDGGLELRRWWRERRKNPPAKPETEESNDGKASE